MKIRRLFPIIFLVLVVAVVLLSVRLCGSRIKNSEIKVALSPDIYPFIYTENDTLKGLEVDLLSLLETRLKIPFTFENLRFGILLKSFYDGDFDIAIGSIEMTDNRREHFDFSHSYYDATQVFLSSKDNPVSLDSLSAVSSHRVGVVNNSTSLFYIEEQLIKLNKFSANNLRRYSTHEALFSAVQSGEVALVLLEHSVAEMVSEAQNLQIVYTSDAAKKYAIVLKKDSPLTSPLNQTLTRIFNSNEWSQSKVRHLSETL